MKRDVKPITTATISPVEGMRTIVDRRNYLAPDHLVDALARGYALEILTEFQITKAVTCQTARHLTKVTYG